MVGAAGGVHLQPPEPARHARRRQLLRRDFTGVAKKEAAHDPGFGPVGRLADVAFVDRGNSAQGRDGARAGRGPSSAAGSRS